MNKNLRKRKIKALYKISSRDDDSFEDDDFSEEEYYSGKEDMPLISNFQCNTNSAAWIDPDGEIHYIPNESYFNYDEYKKEIVPMYDHSNYIFKVLLKDKEGDPSENYMDWINNEGKRWVKVSNYRELSIDTGIPTQAQFDAFGKIHIECLDKTISRSLFREESDIIIFIINGGLAKRELVDNIHLFVSKDHPEEHKRVDIKNHNVYDSIKVPIKAHEFFSKYCSPNINEAYYSKLDEIIGAQFNE